MDKNMTNWTKKYHKKGYMAQDKQNKKLNHCSKCENQSVSQEEFDKMVKVLLNTPPRKRTKKDRKKI